MLKTRDKLIISMGVLSAIKRKTTCIDKTQTLPIISNLDFLTVKISRHFHKMNLNVPNIRAMLHHSVNRTVTLILHSRLGVFIPKIRALTTEYSLSCGICNLTYKRTYFAEAGTRVQNLSEESPFYRASADVLGPIELAPYLHSRKKIKAYVLAICCVFTGEIQFETIDSMTCESILMGIKLIIHRRDVLIRFIHTDNFSSFNSLAKMKIKINRVDGQGESQTLTFKPNISYTKERNVIERFIQCSKYYLRQATNRVFSTVKGPLTYFQNNLLYAQIGAILNSIPYNVNSKLSPGILHRSE